MSLLESGLENDEGPAAAATGPSFLPRRKPTHRAPEPSRCQSLIPANGRFDSYGGSNPPGALSISRLGARAVAPAVGARLRPVAAQLHRAPARRAVSRVVVEGPAAAVVAARLQRLHVRRPSRRRRSRARGRAGRRYRRRRRERGGLEVEREARTAGGCRRTPWGSPSSPAGCWRRAARGSPRGPRVRGRARPPSPDAPSARSSASQSRSRSKSTVFTSRWTRRSGSGAWFGRS